MYNTRINDNVQKFVADVSHGKKLIFTYFIVVNLVFLYIKTIKVN